MQAILHKLLELPEPSIFDRPMEIYEEFKFTKDDQQALMDIADEKHSPEENILLNEQQQLILSAIRTLSPFKQSIITLRDIDNHS